MADPILAKTIGVKAPPASAGEYIIIRNLTRGGQLTKKVEGTQSGTVFNPAPNLEWQEGDLIQAEMHGRLQGVGQENIKDGGATFKKLSVSVDTATPSVGL